jgi:hypothetical protein
MRAEYTLVEQSIEHRPVADVFVSDLDRIDLLGKNARITLYVDEYAATGGPPVKVVAAKIIMPIEVIPLACARILFALGQVAFSAVQDFSRRFH